jgi:two-component system chemotaxis response regulator CheB
MIKYKAIVIGVSAGGLNALSEIFSRLPADFPIPVMVTQHLHPDDDGSLAEILSPKSSLKIIEAMDKMPVVPGTVYLAPPNYHLLIERDNTLALSKDQKTNYSRPSIDVMFETAAYAYGDKLIGIILTGANNDGSAGISLIKDFGGLTIAQDPAVAEFPAMPEFAVSTGKIDKIFSLEELSRYLKQMTEEI